MSMTIQQAIDKIAFHYKQSTTVYHECINRGFCREATGHRQDMEAEQMALEALREKAARENPNPLTIEELRQMNGEPVWVVELNNWAIVNVEEGGRWDGIPFVHTKIGGVSVEWNAESRNLLCYRHKPKEEHHEN